MPPLISTTLTPNRPFPIFSEHHEVLNESDSVAESIVQKKYEDGKYIGHFLNGKRHGRGQFHWNSEHSYDGEWKNDEPNGIGR